MNLSLLQNFKANNFFLDPFPHIIIENALPEKLYKELADTYPINKFNHDHGYQNSVDLGLTSEQVKKDIEINELWKKFVSFHKSKEFCHQVFDIFSKNILDSNPDFFKSKSELYSLKIGSKDTDSADIFPEFTIYCNTEVTKRSARLGIHTDTPNKFTTGLLYMKDNYDNAGGDLLLHNWRVNLPFFLKKIILAKRKNFLNNIIKKLQFLFIGNKKKLKYSSNTFVMYLDSINGLHSVSPREVTKNIRKYCFFRVTYKRRLYDSYSIIDKAFNLKNFKFP